MPLARRSWDARGDHEEEAWLDWGGHEPTAHVANLDVTLAEEWVGGLRASTATPTRTLTPQTGPRSRPVVSIWCSWRPMLTCSREGSAASR